MKALVVLPLCLALSACSLMPTKTHLLPTGGQYQGELHDDTHLAHGYGELTDSYGNLYQGQFELGVKQGQGRLQYNDGSVFEGIFADDEMVEGTLIVKDILTYTGSFQYQTFHGQGEARWKDGREYVGQFANGQFHGQGRLTTQSGDVYEGDFYRDQYQGEGTLTKADGSMVEGPWFKGKPIDERLVWVKEQEQAFYQQPRILANTLKQVAKGKPGEAEIFALLIAASNRQTVFADEIQQIGQILSDYGVPRDQQIHLINPKEQASLTTPIASRYAIEKSVQQLRQQMQSEDMLLVYYSSHGAPDMLELSLEDFPLYSLHAKELTQILDQHPGQQTVIISACYSGSFVDDLATEQRAVITASSATTTSFGCSDSNTMTYFGRALFAESWLGQPTPQLAFSQAKTLVTEWEEKEDLTPSNPQIHWPEKFGPWYERFTQR